MPRAAAGLDVGALCDQGIDGGLVQRFTPEGKLDREIALPMAKPSMCAFGGPRLDTLMVTSIDPGTGGDAGAVVLLRPGVQGVAETPFGAHRS